MFSENSPLKRLSNKVTLRQTRWEQGIRTLNFLSGILNLRCALWRRYPCHFVLICEGPPNKWITCTHRELRWKVFTGRIENSSKFKILNLLQLACKILNFLSCICKIVNMVALLVFVGNLILPAKSWKLNILPENSRPSNSRAYECPAKSLTVPYSLLSVWF